MLFDSGCVVTFLLSMRRCQALVLLDDIKRIDEASSRSRCSKIATVVVTTSQQHPITCGNVRSVFDSADPIMMKKIRLSFVHPRLHSRTEMIRTTFRTYRTHLPVVGKFECVPLRIIVNRNNVYIHHLLAASTTS
jgi:hypothetical protein